MDSDHLELGANIYTNSTVMELGKILCLIFFINFCKFSFDITYCYEKCIKLHCF